MDHTCCHKCGSTHAVFNSAVMDDVCVDCGAKWNDWTAIPIYRPLSEKRFPNPTVTENSKPALAMTVEYALPRTKRWVLLQFITTYVGTVEYEWVILPGESPKQAVTRAEEYLINVLHAVPIAARS